MMKTTEQETHANHNQVTAATYPIQVSPLATEEGGGFQALFPRLARSIVGYGPTPQEAITDLHLALPLFLQRLDKTKQTLPSALTEEPSFK